MGSKMKHNTLGRCNSFFPEGVEGRPHETSTNNKGTPQLIKQGPNNARDA